MRVCGLFFRKVCKPFFTDRISLAKSHAALKKGGMTRGVEGRKKSQRLKDAGFHECFKDAPTGGMERLTAGALCN